MNYAVSIDRKPGYLHAVVTGENSKSNVARYIKEILRECTARNCFNVLIEERLEGPRLGTMDVFDLVSEGSTRTKGPFKVIAYVDVNAIGNLMQFAETVAVNRGMPLAVFSNVAEAETWLQNEIRGAQ
jgi:hypothetical protein